MNGRISPRTRIPSTVHPARRHAPPHSECWHQEWDHGSYNAPGTVRRCPYHGQVQILTEGRGADYWRDLSPLWNPILYRRAVAALHQAGLP